jgi:hypothetical protein
MAIFLLMPETHPKIVQELLDQNEICMTLDISSPVLPTFQENAMTHLTILLAPQDLWLLSSLMSSKRKDTIKRREENQVHVRLKSLQKARQRFLQRL